MLIGIFAFAQIMTDIEKLLGRPGRRRGGAGAPSLEASRHLKVNWEIFAQPFLLAVVDDRRPDHRHPAGDRRQRLQRDGLRPGQEVLQDAGEFGKGHPEGIIASEASNNANVSGSLMTIMAFGIPGDAVTAVMLGAMTIHGIQSGPLFISQNRRSPTASTPPTSWRIR